MHIHTHVCRLHTLADMGPVKHISKQPHRRIHTPAEPPNCPNGWVQGEEFNSDWVALQVLGINCLRVNVRQKDKYGHFTGHWFLLPDDQPHSDTALAWSSFMQLHVAPNEMLVCLFSLANMISITQMSRYVLYINVCSHAPPNVILIRVLYYAHPESRLWNRVRMLVEVISQFWVCICSIDLQYVNSCNAGLAYGPSASLEARPAWCLITARLSRVLSVN